MASQKLLSLLLIGIFCLALVNKSNAECCTSKEEVIYRTSNGNCEDVGGIDVGSNICQVYICPDGFPLVGTYCGKGSCNIFGCNCDGGCLIGDWSRSFVQNYQEYGISVLRATRTPL
ncbi:protein Diedel-like [Drosophila ficusphila]|uniref:protein Diedel-like n=1 Tax=Drosophila ficusphila TaxID=30025 RepID=UPI0007E6AD55|nr:protein Diedel-like [Drosophila ficusphila]